VVDITRMIILNGIEKSKDKAVNMLVEYVCINTQVSDAHVQLGQVSDVKPL